MNPKALIEQDMTLRDYFAAKVIGAVMAGAYGLGTLNDEQRAATLLAAAEICYETADAMLKARAK